MTPRRFNSIAMRASSAAIILGVMCFGLAMPAAAQILPSMGGGQRNAGVAALESISSMSDDALRQQYESDRKEVRLFRRRYDVALAEAWRKVLRQGSDEERLQVERALRATLGDLAERSPAELAARITDRGGVDDVNIEMRDATLHLAMLARITRDSTHADRAAALLARFAEVIPHWPIWNPTFPAANESRRPCPQDDPKTFGKFDSAGLWGTWIYDDLIMGTPLVEASSILEPTGAIERTGAKKAIRRMFDLHLETLRKFSPTQDFTNQDVFPIIGMMDFGLLLGEPELIHEAVRRLRDMYRYAFYWDGWHKEASTSYHSILQNDLRDVIENKLKGYSDPAGFRSKVDGARFDDLDLSMLPGLAAQSRRADAVMKTLVLPDGNYLAIHDTDWPIGALNSSTPPRNSHLFGAMGQGSLITGNPRDDSYTRVTLHWGLDAGHAHRDSLNLNLWAKNTEAISETAYEPKPGSNSTREWHTSTAGHATVVVDGVDQYPEGKFRSRRRQPQPGDAIPGKPDWRWRWAGYSYQDGGDLRLFNARHPEVQVIEADATHAYDSVTDIVMYRRTIALVKIDDMDSYVVDVFRVRGKPGSEHTFDWMLHGSLQLGQRARVSAPLQPTPGTAHTMLRNLRSGRVDGSWLAAFEMANGVTLLSFMTPEPGGGATTVFQGEGPAMRRNGDAPFVFARRTGDEAIFVAVHHVLVGQTPRVRGIELLPTECAECVAFKVTLDTRTDTVVSCADRSKICTVPGGIEMRGLFAHVAEGKAPGDQWALLVDGDLLRTPQALVEGETSASGVARGTLRAEAGDPVNGFIVDASLPEGRGFSDSALIVDQAGEMTWAYSVEGVSRRSAPSGSVVIETRDEPAMIITPASASTPGAIKQTYYPCWGFTGDARWRIPGDAMARPGPGDPRDPAPTGVAKATWTGGASGAR